MAGLFPDIIGTTLDRFRIGISNLILKLDNNNLRLRNSDDSADAKIIASTLDATDNSITLNSDAAGSGSDYTYQLSRPATGMTGNVDFIYPTTMGSPGQVLGTDGTSSTSWINASNTDLCVKTDVTVLNHNSASSVAMFTLPANAKVLKVQCGIITTFDGSPSASVGIDSAQSEYMGANRLSLTGATDEIYEVNPRIAADASTRDIKIYYSAGGATQGQAELIVYYSTPA